jgi:hypothetical protein
MINPKKIIARRISLGFFLKSFEEAALFGSTKEKSRRNNRDLTVNFIDPPIA